MGDVLFYHLTQSSLEEALPQMLERAQDRGWRVIVRAASTADLTALDTHLWTYDAASFLPHGMEDGAAQPIYLTTGTEVPNAATVLMLVSGAALDPAEAARFDRVCLLFNGYEAEAVAAARTAWRAVRDAGLSGTYWAQEEGRWLEKAKTYPGRRHGSRAIWLSRPLRI
ncbi:MAG: DNA polymerase III subunit chi [Pseudomonadota bacterium]